MGSKSKFRMGTPELTSSTAAMGCSDLRASLAHQATVRIHLLETIVPVHHRNSRIGLLIPRNETSHGKSDWSMTDTSADGTSEGVILEGT